MSTYEPTDTYDTEPPAAAIFIPINKLNRKITCTHLIDSFLLDTQHQSVDLLSFRSYIETGIVETASDGSVKDGQGTYAVIFTAGGKELWFQGPVDCHPSLIQSYRAELTGLLAIKLLLKRLGDYSNEEIVSNIMAYLDNKSAVTANNQDDAYPGVKAVWVEAHQDSKYPSRQLTPEAVLNCK
eukprot:11309246-Ditylum_brightwellii.AAC.1